MKKLWEIIENKPYKEKQKFSLFILINSIIAMIFGTILWIIFRNLNLNSIDWLLCFMGYPAVFIGLYGSVFYLMRKKSSSGMR